MSQQLDRLTRNITLEKVNSRSSKLGFLLIARVPQCRRSVVPAYRERAWPVRFACMLWLMRSVAVPRVASPLMVLIYGLLTGSVSVGDMLLGGPKLIKEAKAWPKNLPVLMYHGTDDKVGFVSL